MQKVTYCLAGVLVLLLTLSVSPVNLSLVQPRALRDHFERSSRHFPTPKVHRCGEVGQDLVVNFVNANYPNDDTRAGDCRFRMVVSSQHTCQIRVDFVDTELLDPVRGECLSQFFIVQGAIWPTGLPPLCGINSDQHFYIHLEPWYSNASIVDFNLVTVTRGRPYRFGVWLTQIDCASANLLKAPEGCSQYFLGENGTIKSFNYEGFRYLSGQNYEICIRPVRGVCGIRYNAPEGDFAMKKSGTPKKDEMLRSGVGATTCGTDYLLIPEGREVIAGTRIQRLLFNRRRRPAAAPAPPPARKRVQVTPSEDRFCGAMLSPVANEKSNKPIFARVRSNLIYLRVKTTPLQESKGSVEVLNMTTGFRIAYTQLKECGEDQEEPDLAVSLTADLGNGAQNGTRNATATAEDEATSGETTRIKASFGNVTTTPAGASSSTTEEPEEDKELWDYLETHTDDDTADDEKDLYDF